MLPILWYWYCYMPLRVQNVTSRRPQHMDGRLPAFHQDKLAIHVSSTAVPADLLRQLNYCLAIQYDHLFYHTLRM
jgi:hypothetical protein